LSRNVTPFGSGLPPHVIRGGCVILGPALVTMKLFAVPTVNVAESALVNFRLSVALLPLFRRRPCRDGGDG